MARADAWTTDELREALRAYLEVLAWEESGTPFSPTLVHRELARGSLAGRTEGSIGRRMSNISAVMKAAGEPLVQRYKPDFDHVGANVTNTLLQLLDEFRSQANLATSDFRELGDRANALLARGPIDKPSGSLLPKARETTAVVYDRSPQVVAWVLQQANGLCDACGTPAPFNSVSGRPFLEVHHVRRLADGGADVVENAVALCPNCHRRLHHSSDAPSYARQMVQRVPRLVSP